MLPNNWFSTSLKDNCIFWGKIFFEFLLWIPLTMYEVILKSVSFRVKDNYLCKYRLQSDDKIYINIHEWGGYPIIRTKMLKNGKTFECGLRSQLQYYKSYMGLYKLSTIVTMSNPEMCLNIDWIRDNSDVQLFVDNAGYDFSGYEATYRYLKKKGGNPYILLSNSSVNSRIDNYIDGYINYLKKNLDVGILGISMSETFPQTLIRNNYKPHIQSFFLLTTLDVLDEIVKANNNIFPGKNMKHKLLLIREGEIKISQMALNLGYKLAVVQSNGKVIKFGRKCWLDNCYSTLFDKKVENRLYVEYPNRIYPIQE